MKNILYLSIFIVLSSVTWVALHDSLQPKTVSEMEHINPSPFSDVRVIQNPTFNEVSLYLVFPSGEASNTFDKGLAHYVEHLAWLSAFGTDQHDGTRHSNAWTNHFSTGYWQTIEKDKLHIALRTLVSVSEDLNLEANFALEERDIILREYDYRVLERPLYPVLREMSHVLYGDGALARSVIGEPAVIAKYALDEAKALHKQSHILAQASLLIYGDVSKARVESAIASLSLANGPALSMPPTSPPFIADGNIKDRATVFPSGLSEETYVFRKLVPLRACNSAANCAILAQMVENALDSTLPGGLAGPLRYDQFVARSFSFNIDVIAQDYIEISFFGHPDNDVDLEELESVFHASLNETLQNGVPQETFDRVAARLSGQFDAVLEREWPSYNRDLALHQLMNAQPIFTLEDQINAVENTRLKDVNEFIESMNVDGREVARLVRTKR